MTLNGPFLKRLAASALLAVLPAVFCGCGAADADELFVYCGAPAEFSLIFPSQYGDVTCDAVKNGDTVVLKVRSPERSAGVAVTCGAAGCTIEADGTVIPLSENAASALTNVIRTICSGEAESSAPTRSADGTETVISYPYGTLTLNENLMPCRVECAAVNGENRTVRIENYTLLPLDEEG